MAKAKKASEAPSVEEVSKKAESLKISESKPAKAAKKSVVVRDSSEERPPSAEAAKKSPKKKAEPGAPKRTRKPSEYNLFIGEQIRRIGEEKKEIAVTERMKMAQKLWKEKKQAAEATA